MMNLEEAVTYLKNYKYDDKTSEAICEVLNVLELLELMNESKIEDEEEKAVLERVRQIIFHRYDRADDLTHIPYILNDRDYEAIQSLMYIITKKNDRIKTLEKGKEPPRKIDVFNEENTVENDIDYSKCLHCDEGEPRYCESCYQDLISKDMELQTKCKELEKERDGIYQDYQDLGKEKHLLEEDLDRLDKLYELLKATSVPEVKIHDLITQIEWAISFIKTGKSTIKVDQVEQQEQDLNREIEHLKKLLKGE